MCAWNILAILMTSDHLQRSQISLHAWAEHRRLAESIQKYLALSASLRSNPGESGCAGAGVWAKSGLHAAEDGVWQLSRAKNTTGNKFINKGTDSEDVEYTC